MCTLAKREEIPAELIGTDPLSDIAVIKLRRPTPRTFPVADSAIPPKLEVGDRVSPWAVRWRCRSRSRWGSSATPR